MRKITAGLFVALDGVVEAPDQWHFPYFNDEMGAAVDGQLGAADTILLGRNTYDSFAGAWPDREAGGDEDAEFAKKLGDTRKIVVSRQNLEFTWRNSELAQGRPRRGGCGVEERTRRRHRDERLRVGGPAAAGRRTARRTASAGAPDRGRQGHAPVRRGRVDPIETLVVSDV